MLINDRVFTFKSTTEVTEVETRYKWSYVQIRNDGDNTIYISNKSNIVANDDGVLSVPSGSSAMFPISGKVFYLMGDTTVQIIMSNEAICPFSSKAKGGESNSGGSGSNKNYRLIERITVTEDNIREISRNAEPDGTPYNFTDIAIFCPYTSDVSATESCTFGIIINNDESYSYENQLYYTSGTYKNALLLEYNRATLTSYVQDGRGMNSIITARKNRMKYTTTIGKATEVVFPDVNEKIKSVSLVAYNSAQSAAPIGTIIEIYGK